MIIIMLSISKVAKLQKFQLFTHYALKDRCISDCNFCSLTSVR